MRAISLFLTILFSMGLLSPSFAKTAPADHYARMPQFYDAALSPDGKFLAAIMDNNGQYILRVFNLSDPSDKTVRGTRYNKETRVNSVKWVNNDYFLVDVSVTQKIGAQLIPTGFIYVIDKDVKKPEILLEPSARGGMGSNLTQTTGFRQFNNEVIDYLPNEPDHILMAFGKEDQFKKGVHKMNIKTGNHKIVKRGSIHIQHWLTDRRSELRVGTGQRDRTGKWETVVRDTNGDEWREVSHYPGITGDTNIVGFTDNPNEMIITSYNGKNTVGFLIYDLSQKRVTRTLFQHDKFDVSGLIFSPDQKKVVGARFVDDATNYVYFDTGYESRLKPISNEFNQYNISYIDMTPDMNKVLFKATAPSLPARLYIYDRSTAKFSVIGDDYPEIGKTQQADVTKVKYKTRDGYRVQGYMTTPPAIAEGRVALEKQPFIILPHGGPYARDTESFDFLTQFLASRGYSVLQMNFRGSDGFGYEHQQAGRKNWEVMQEDVEDGTRWLIRKGYADPDRICIVGWSYGGYAALMGSIKNPDLYQCAISIAGVTDLNDMVKDIKAFRFGKFTAQNFVLKGFEDKDDIKVNSPKKRASELTVPVLLAHGTKDVVVEYDHFKSMKNALKKSKAKSTYLTFEDGDHSLTNSAHRLDLFNAMDKHLKSSLGASAAAP